MPFGPEDQALATLLVETKRARASAVLEAVAAAGSGPKSFSEVLLENGLVEPRTLESLLADARSKAPSPTMEDEAATRPSPPATILDAPGPSVGRDDDEATLPYGRGTAEPQELALRTLREGADDWDGPTWAPGTSMDRSADLRAERTNPWTRPEDRITPILEAGDEATLAARPASSESHVQTGGAAREVDLDLSTDPHRLAPSGRYADERYQLLSEIGRGGMGRVLRGRDLELGREVAIKVLHAGTEASENVIRRFWMEVQATGQLEHPSIIPVHDVGRFRSGELFYVMKKLSGDTLATVLSSLRSGDARVVSEFPRTRLLTVFQQIVYAVAFAHARGVIHRDIKPANIMIGRYGEAILLDWGLAKLVDEREPEIEASELPRVETKGRYAAGDTAHGTITGTPQYMSPEATLGRPELLTPMTDVYGLGAVLYEILTFEPAFADLGFVPTVMRVRERDFVPPRQRRPDASIPVDLEELCLQAMDGDPKERPTARQLADDLGRILAGAKERERRQAEAKARVREGRRAAERWKALKIELGEAESEARKLAKEVPPWAETRAKEDIWRLEDRVGELEIQAVGAFEEAEALFIRALGEVADDREARGALAALYFARFGEAERARDLEAQRYYRSLVTRYDDGLWARVLEGSGTLEVHVEGEGVEVQLSRYELSGRVLRPVARRSLGVAPVSRFELSFGSHLLTLSRSGERDVLRPVLIGRAESVTVHARFRSGAEIGDDFILVPEGPAILGGDPIAHGALDRHIADLREFAIARFPVTCAEYLRFLNAIARRDPEGAMSHVPRARASEGHYWRLDEETGLFEYPASTPGGQAWVGDLPVNGVSLRDAEAYIEWRGAETGEKLRLPDEQEWEKAARGVDGRFFPWGDHFDATFCKMKDSRNTPYPEPEPVGSFAVDCSPYGVRDMAGGIRELCVAREGGRNLPVMRGGCWYDTGLFCRAAFRHLTHPDFVNTGLGFRLAKDLG